MLVDDKPTNELELEHRTEWAVIQCAHGVLHLQLGRVTLDFSPREFHDLARLVGNAYAKFEVRRAVVGDAAPMH